MNPLEARRRLLGRNVYKRTTEGNPAIAQGSLARMYPGITMQGWTEQDSTTGAQLFDKNTVDTGKYVSDTDGKLYDGIPDRETSASDYVLVSGLSYICVTITSYRQWMAFYDFEKTYISGANGYASPIAVPDGAVYARFTVSNDYIDSFMVNAGQTLLPYEPYTGGQPSPSPEYPQEIVSAGKYNEDTQKWEYEINMGGAQLFDESDIQVVSIDPEGDQRNGFEITGLKPGQYTISTKQKTIGTIAYLYANVKNSSGEYGKVQYIVTNVDTNTVAISISSGDTLIIYDARRPNSTEVSKDIFSEYGIMLNIGSVALPYQPYHTPQTVTFTADRPLTKWDRLVYMDGQWQWEYGGKNIVLNGSENWVITGEVNDNFAGFALRSEEYNAKIYNVMSVCDKFPYSLESKPNTQRQEDSIYGLRFHIGYSELPNQTVAEFKKYLKNNPVKFIYQLSDSEYAPLSEPEQEQMNALHTFRPTTVLSNDCECNMSLTYKTKKSLEVTT